MDPKGWGEFEEKLSKHKIFRISPILINYYGRNVSSSWNSKVSKIRLNNFDGRFNSQIWHKWWRWGQATPKIWPKFLAVLRMVISDEIPEYFMKVVWN